MKQKEVDHETWLDLSDAAAFLGVHFTTLRRWADSGEIAYMRTPGRRRRFAISALEQFLKRVVHERTGDAVLMPAYQPIEQRAIDIARQSVRNLPSAGNHWLGKISEEQRLRLKSSGHRLMALLLQYNGRSDGGEAFLEEGKRISSEYAQVCSMAGLSVTETVRVFLFFRRSILDAIHETGKLGGSDDAEGLRLYFRTTEFLDDLLISLIASYTQASTPIIE